MEKQYIDECNAHECAYNKLDQSGEGNPTGRCHATTAVIISRYHGCLTFRRR